MIGVTSYVEPVARGDFADQPSVVLPVGYVRHIERAGAVAVVLPPPAGVDPAAVAAAAAAVLARIDGLILAGGADIEAPRYGVPADVAAQGARPDRDEWELALVRAADDAGIPLLGICRGMQIMAVAAGGTLEQHIPDRTGTVAHSPTRGVFSQHPVTPVEGTNVADILGTQTLSVCTYHHQAVATAPGYIPAAWHGDGTLEAMERPGAAFRVAVQWHPEEDVDTRLVEALVAVARAGE
ncbi:gamma-glutamyl-gamma-aminobutyrate hydrolase family protein [Tsukamurella soli]|uniref:gamma-glutamyl-gamma-aminobutyrate hydrolase family protein n=1 Tax=Tsukamurella soli TaxID=644556 RepID=UPI0031E72F85